MNKALITLIERLENPDLVENNVIPWSSPIPSFGDLSKSKVATLGLNPSNREFVDNKGKELDGTIRRFHTLKSLKIKRWSEVNDSHIQLIANSCEEYFNRNPYDGWFKSLDSIISGTRASYYDTTIKACHLDLVPYATACKWTELTPKQRSLLLDIAGDTLALLLKDSPIRLLILNGVTVVNNLEKITGLTFEKRVIPSWTLPRKDTDGVKGYSYRGKITEIHGIKLKQSVSILGFNHNIQSSFGVTNEVKKSIRHWVTQSANEIL